MLIAFNEDIVHNGKEGKGCFKFTNSSDNHFVRITDIRDSSNYPSNQLHIIWNKTELNANIIEWSSIKSLDMYFYKLIMLIKVDEKSWWIYSM